MIDFSTLSPGDKLGCRYTFTSGAAGTFSNLSSTPTDGRKVKDPLVVEGSYFKAINMAAADPDMVPIASVIKMLTVKTFRTTDTVLPTGNVAETDDYVDFSLYKNVISFTTTDAVVLTAIPKDVLLQTKDLIGINDFASAINSITISLSNIFCKVALTTDGVTYYTYNGSTWVTVDMTQSTDVLKTTLADYATINALNNTNYAGLSLNGKLGFKLLIGIDGTDTAKSYSLNSITIDYVGTNDSSPSIQYFNFVFAGYTKEGNAKLVADKPIQTSISYSALHDAKFVQGRDKIQIANSKMSGDFYIRLIGCGISLSGGSEYDSFIAGAVIPTGGKTNAEFWDTSIATLTRTVAALTDDDGIVAGTTNIIARGGLSITKYSNIGYNATSVDVGFRPVLIVDLNCPKESRPGTVLPVVTSTLDLVPGKAISCEYTGGANALGTFKNLGCATKGYLNDFNNATPDGTFFFNCVGYTKEGKLKLVADRVIHTDISLAAIYSGKTPSIVSGTNFDFDRQHHTIRLLNALSESQPVAEGGEYSDIITNSLNVSKTVEEIWHTKNCLNWTNTISAAKSTSIVVKGFGEEGLNASQRICAVGTLDKQIGFRPVLIIEPVLRIEKLVVTPYVGYEKDSVSKNIKVDIIVAKADNTVGEYSLIRKDNSAVLSGYATTESRIIDVATLNNNGVTTISIKEKLTGIVVDEFVVFRDTLYRETTHRTFAAIYSGYQLNHAQVVNAVAKPKLSSITPAVVSGGASYIAIDKNTNKITVK